MDFNLHTLRGDWHYPTRIYFGPGRITELTAVCRAVGMARPLLVTDATLAALPAVRDAVKLNEERGLPTAIFADVQSNPVGRNVHHGLEAFRAGAHDGVIAMGGGSAMDTGKVIALMARQTADFWDYAGRWHQIVADAIAPVVAVPTTSGTGSEVARAAVITNEHRQEKTIVLHPGLIPKAVVADPSLTTGLPPTLTAATGMDALAHCLEALCAPYYHPMSDGIAMEAIRYVRNWLPVAVREGDNLQARVHMMAAATMGAVAFQKGLGAIHALSHPVGAVYNTHHGLANAVFMPYVMAINRPAIEEKMQRLGRFLGLGPRGTDAILDWILELRSDIGIPHTLRELGIPSSRFQDLATRAAADPCGPENPVPLGYDAFLQLYQDAYTGRLARP